jgi:serine/threonine protein kinase
MNLTHRDIKTSNLVYSIQSQANSSESRVDVRVIDFSSAFAINYSHMFDPWGPSSDEETTEYSPPEVLLLLSVKADGARPYTPTLAYDSWSIGIVMLELLLATNQVSRITTGMVMECGTIVMRALFFRC